MRDSSPMRGAAKFACLYLDKDDSALIHPLSHPTDASSPDWGRYRGFVIVLYSS